ncbi:MAG: hypothetical protein JWL77_3991 [Chthonomonadaceae bacterium]|nr:hypothetical protein [Chthonomonadaceae bacterium]
MDKCKRISTEYTDDATIEKFFPESPFLEALFAIMSHGFYAASDAKDYEVVLPFCGKDGLFAFFAIFCPPLPYNKTDDRPNTLNGGFLSL